jgi:AcrR family transcriptional regulator
MAVTKKEAISQAALELFAENGVGSTTTRQIAQRAQTAEGNLYRHFKSKDDLVERLFAQSAEVFHNTLAASANGEDEPQKRLELLVRGVFTFASQSSAAFDYLLSVHHTGVLKCADQPLPMRLFVETLEAGMASGAFREVQPVLTTGWIVALTQRAVVLQRSHLLSTPNAEVVGLTVEAALRLVSPHHGNPGFAA